MALYLKRTEHLLIIFREPHEPRKTNGTENIEREKEREKEKEKNA
jgi:hypothetical protein